MDGLILHLHGAGLNVDEAGLILEWADQSPAGNDARAPNTLTRPMAVEELPTGRTWVRFDGEETKLILDENLFPSSTETRTLFAVVASDDYRGHIIGTGSGSSSYLTSYGFGLGLNAAKPFLKANSNYAGVYLMSADNLILQGPQVIAARVGPDGADLRTRCHLATIETAPEPYAYASTYVGGRLGNDEALNGDIGELIVYDSRLSDTEYDAVIDHLAQKWTLPMNPALDSDADGTLDSCDDGMVFIGKNRITPVLDYPASLRGGTLANVSNLSTATALDLHTQSSHVWVTSASGTGLTLNFDQPYDLAYMHFWNYFSEDYDVDEIEVEFFGAAGDSRDLLVVEPATSDRGVAGEDIRLSVDGVERVVVRLKGSNSQIDFQNIGFSGYPTQ